MNPHANESARGVSRSAKCDCVFTPRKREKLSTPLLVVSWSCRIVAAAILLQTLWFKFTGAPESVYIFTKVGLEPFGRYASGVAELFAAMLLLFPRTTWAGALLAAGVMIGGIGSHLTLLGIVVRNDGGLLFALALIVLACALTTTYVHRRQIPVVGNSH
jgi:putative oxidoreductase